VLRKIMPFLLSAIIILGAVGTVFAQTEDEIVSKFMKKTEKKHVNKVGFIAAYFSYGKLSDNSSYNKYSIFVDKHLHALNPSDLEMDGAYRSDQLGVSFGMMVASRMAVKLGFEYWLKMGTDKVGDYSFSSDLAPYGEQRNFNLVSELQVYGITSGLDLYLLNPPDKFGQFHSLAFRISGGGGFYMTQWKIWNGSSSFNLSTGASEANVEPLKGSAPGFYGGIGFDLPIRFLGMTLGSEAIYMVMNFNSVKSYNRLGEELYLSYPDETSKPIKLDYSGPRGKIELKKFFSW